MQAECPFSAVIYIKMLLALIWSQKLINQTEYRNQAMSKRSGGFLCLEASGVPTQHLRRSQEFLFFDFSCFSFSPTSPHPL